MSKILRWKKRPSRLLRTSYALIALLIVTAAIAQTPDPMQARRVAIWGSSVANGTGDELQQGGYAGQLKKLMQSRDWQVFSQSRDGDSTVTITERFAPGEQPDPQTKYLTSVSPNYVVIGLSLGNEGIAQCQLGQSSDCASTKDAAEAIFEQFASGLQQLISRARIAGITPIVTLPYARSDFWEREYTFTRRMNLLINSWDVPSVNLLGAIDDGQGRWARGMWSDPWHPNSAGYTEMFHAFVPSLFDALETGKPLPRTSHASGFARIRKNVAMPIWFDVDDTMRSFTLSFKVRPGDDGVIAAVHGQSLDQDYSIVRRTYGNFQWDTESLDLQPAEPFSAMLSISNGSIRYRASAGSAVSAPAVVTGAWHYVTLSHYAARGESLLYVDGELAGKVDERLQPLQFVLGGSARADYRDWMIHRAGLNADEVRTLHDGGLLQASMEIYAPLTPEDGIENRAQSLSEIQLDSEAVRLLSD
jgi:lysophospholipase L1-like esterase